jgi:large repetitive protein
VSRQFTRAFVLLFVCALAAFAAPAAAQPLLKSAIQVDPGNTKPVGQTFGYRLTYNCSSTSGPCLNAQVVDLLPVEVQFVSTVPASPTGDVAAINVTPNFGGSGRTRVQFVLINPLPAGNSGDLLINVRFPNGSTPDGTMAVNTADGINLGAAPGTFTTPPVTVTAVATVQVNLTKTLLTSPANLDLPESYRLRISVPNVNGALNLTAIGPVTDTLPPGTVFNGATPAADCQPGCVGTTPATVTWSAPCTVPLQPNQNCDITVNVTFPSATFPSGTNVTNMFTADATPLGEPPATFGPGTVTHPVTTFVPAPGAGFTKNMAGGTPSPPTLNQTFSYDLNISNNGNVPLDNLVVIDTLPVELQVLSVTTGAYTGLADFAAGVGVRVSYEKNTALGVFTLWGSSPNTTTSTTLTAPPPGLGAGEFITRIRWEYGQAQPGMANSTRPLITGRIVNPDNAGGPVAIGDPIQNCAALTAVYTAGPTNVNRNDCESFNVSGPFVQLNPAKENLSGGGPFNPGQTVSWRLRVRSDARSSDPVPLAALVATDLLPVNLVFATWTFDDQGTGLPAPQVFDQIPNFAGTGRTLLRWRWNAGSGNLGVNQQVWINVSTTIRNGAPSGNLSNDFTLDSDPAGLAQRCTGSSQADALDYDEDGDTAETLCRATGTINVAGIAQLISGKTIQGTCDGGSVPSSAGTLTGGAIEYRLRVQNVGTVPMQNFVLIDILPFVGDTGVRDTNPRGSQWTPLLAAPITPPPGTTLYYSTSGNPCRGEVGGPVAGCDPPNWTTVPPVPITSVRSFKIEFGARVVQPFDFLEFTFTMTAPGNLPPGATAFNSFAYQADRADGLGALAAEPQKVGIALGTCEAAGLGDFVWVDVDADGVQDDGPTGLNDVFVRLFAPGPDGLPGTVDDVPLASAVTGNGPGGAPGWYSFPGLAPGSYLVCATLPATFEWTVRDQGGEAADSDADPATGCSPVVVLATNEQNPNIDFGLIATRLAALGNYVWFDRNADGLQNEPQTAGANGVTVRLWVDDGDGSPEPGTGDALVATTVTADDVFGQPGYYLFDGLIPGLRYFVQFVLPASATGFTGQDAGGDDTVDSDAAPANGATATVVLAPDEVNRTLDAGLVTATGTLALGDQVWMETDDDGLFEPENGEMGVDGARLDLYLDVNGDGEPTLDEYIGTTSTATASGFAGRYRFDGLAPGTYIVVVSPSSFGGGGALSGKVSSTGNDPAPDPDDDANGDDNGTPVGALTASLPVTLTDNGEPTSEDGDNDTNLTVDFGFVASGPGAVTEYDYGDAPDVIAGTAPGDYNTTALDTGAFHSVSTETALHLGACVDADNGFNQDPAASRDDTTGFGIVIGACAGGGSDDEDGVTFTGPFTPGGTASFSVTAGGDDSCLLDAWVDWNGSGVFGDSAGEQIAASTTIPTGAPTVLSPAVPAGALPGLTYARFRCSSEGDVAPTGFGGDGEVEDYVVSVIGTDLGDAPASYGTQGAGAASHTIDPLAAPRLGACVDTEGDGQPTPAADGDDTSAGTFRVGTCFDDEDGVAFNSVFAACQTGQLTVTVSGASGDLRLDGWIDWSADGDFADAGEQVFTTQIVNPGANPLSLNVPCTAVEGTTYARFRLSTAGGLGATGAAPDGEVEDYAVNVGAVDFGDAPDTYGTLLASGGPNHRVVAGFTLGATVDSEPEGQPSVGATGDDLVGDDEDGVTLPGGGVLTACSSASVTVNLTNTAGVNTPRLDAWIDFDGDGAFGEPRDRIATGLALVAGANVVPVNVPCDARTAASYARFRLSSTGVAGSGGAADDGEVEDYPITVQGLDFGDAADPTYPTLLASNGARHAVLVAGNPTLGALVDTEGNGQPTAALSGDDLAGDDEDGVTFPAVFVPGTTGSLTLQGGATGGVVSCWIDWNRNGSWGDAGDQVVTDLAVGAGATATPTFAVPVGAPQGTAPVRCRISTAGGLAVTGLAANGEVEDHPAAVGVEEPLLGFAKRLVSNERDPGNPRVFLVTFEMTLANLGNVPLSNVNATAAFGTVFTPPLTFTVQSLTSTDFTVSPTFDGQANADLLAPGQTLAVGATGVIRVVLRIDTAGERGPYSCSGVARATSPAGTPVTDVSQDGGDPDPDDNGDPGDNGDPTILVFITSVIEIPTLATWGLFALISLLGLAGWSVLRRG